MRHNPADPGTTGSDTAGPGELVLVFAPHPDDDVIACGGTIAARVDAGARVVIVVSTDGSMSHSAVLGIHHDPTPEELTRVRRGEACAAAEVMGVAAQDVYFLGFPDTRLVDSLPEFHAAVAAVLDQHRDVVEVFLPHEVHELNADHRLTGEVVLACLKELGLAPRLRKFVVWDERAEAEFAFVNRSPAARPAGAGERLAEFDIAAHLATKRAALAEHRTQVELFAPGQTRPVVPEAFQRRVLERDTEQFWTEGDR